MLVPYTPGLFTRGYVPASKVLAAINIGFFVLAGALPEEFSNSLALSPENGISWQLLTYQFMHGGVMHLIGNVAFLLAFGPVVEEKLGSMKAVLVYLLGGVAAGLTWMALEEPVFFGDLPIYAPLIGASGSVSALTGASMVLRPHVSMNGIIWIFIIIFRVSFPVWAWALYFFVMDYLNFFGGLFSDSAQSNVAYSAHLGGFVCAFLAMIVLRYLNIVKPASSDLISHFVRAKPTVKPIEKVDDNKATDKILNWTKPAMLPEVLKKMKLGENFPIEGILTLSHVSREQGESIGAYHMLQLWLEKNELHESSSKVAYELGVLCLKHLGRQDLAREWFDNTLKRNPDEQLRQRAETALSVL